MIRNLKPLVLFHWAAVFSLLAVLCVTAGDGGVGQVFNTLGLAVARTPMIPVSAPVATSVMSLAFAVCAVLFWWALLASLTSGPDDGRDVNRDAYQVFDLAFASACGTLTLVMGFGVAEGITGIFPVVAIHVCALLVSYAAVSVREAGTAADKADERDVLGAVRKRAGEASHAVSLVRLSARAPATGSD